MQPKGLISVLLDEYADFSERDDAAMDLATFNEIEVEEALLKILLNINTEELLVDSAAESLKEIWCRKDYFNEPLVNQLHPMAKRYFARKT